MITLICLPKVAVEMLYPSYEALLQAAERVAGVRCRDPRESSPPLEHAHQGPAPPPAAPAARGGGAGRTGVYETPLSNMIVPQRRSARLATGASGGRSHQGGWGAGLVGLCTPPLAPPAAAARPRLGVGVSWLDLLLQEVDAGFSVPQAVATAERRRGEGGQGRGGREEERAGAAAAAADGRRRGREGGSLRLVTVPAPVQRLIEEQERREGRRRAREQRVKDESDDSSRQAVRLPRRVEYGRGNAMEQQIEGRGVHLGSGEGVREEEEEGEKQQQQQPGGAIELLRLIQQRSQQQQQHQQQQQSQQQQQQQQVAASTPKQRLQDCFDELLGLVQLRVHRSSLVKRCYGMFMGTQPLEVFKLTAFLLLNGAREGHILQWYRLNGYEYDQSDVSRICRKFRQGLLSECISFDLALDRNVNLPG